MTFLASKVFWADTAERAIKTFAQTAIALITVAAPATGSGLLEINYSPVVLTGIVAALISVLMSIASAGTGTTNGASLVVETKEK